MLRIERDDAFDPQLRAHSFGRRDVRRVVLTHRYIIMM